ncbi:hypothetical protein JCM8097_001352 [Rhodosporidiobolus ruineniae]
MDLQPYRPLESTSAAAPPLANPSSAPSNTLKPTKRRPPGPAPTSCSGCRRRRVACKRSKEGAASACERCAKLGLECSLLTVSTPSAVARTPKDTLGLSSLETRLADNDMSETLGLELLSLYGDASSSCSDPIYPPPVLDYIGLRGRYEAVGRRLSDLSPADQLTCRIVFASASRLRRPSSASSSESQLVHNLSSSATSHADAASVWRRPSSENATALLLLFQLVAAGEIASEEAKPYMSALNSQVRALYKTQPRVLLGASGGGMSPLLWCVLLFGTLAAVERREASEMPDREYLHLVAGRTGGMPPPQVVLDAIQHDPWLVTRLAVLPLASYINLGRRIASLLNDLRNGHLGAEEVVAVGEVWDRAEVLVDYLDGLISEVYAAATNELSVTVFQLYAQLTYGATLFAILSIIIALEEPSLSTVVPGTAAMLLQHYRSRFLRLACRYLRTVRGSTTSFLAVFAGSAWSVSRLVTFAQLVKSTSAWDAELYPAGPADKLASLDYLQSALNSVGRAYPSEELQAVLQAVEGERGALALVLGVPLSSLPSTPAYLAASSSSNHPSASSSTAQPSLSRLASWTYKNEGYTGPSAPPLAAAAQSQPQLHLPSTSSPLTQLNLTQLFALFAVPPSPPSPTHPLVSEQPYPPIFPAFFAHPQPDPSFPPCPLPPTASASDPATFLPSFPSSPAPGPPLPAIPPSFTVPPAYTFPTHGAPDPAFLESFLAQLVDEVEVPSGLGVEQPA